MEPAPARDADPNAVIKSVHGMERSNGSGEGTRNDNAGIDNARSHSPGIIIIGISGNSERGGSASSTSSSLCQEAKEGWLAGWLAGTRRIEKDRRSLIVYGLLKTLDDFSSIPGRNISRSFKRNVRLRDLMRPSYL
jgi:hypothetical protein